MFKGFAQRVKMPSPASVIATAALVVVVGGVAVAAIPGADGVVKSCYANTTGQLRVIDSDASCAGGETQLSFNQQGPSGPPGPKGDPGSPGPPGEAPSALGTPPPPPLPPKLKLPPKKPGPKVLKQLGVPATGVSGGSEVFMVVRDARTVPRSDASDLTIAELVVPAGRYYVTADATSDRTAGKKVILGAVAYCQLNVGQDSDGRLVFGGAPQLSLATVGRFSGPGRIELRCSNADAALPPSNPLAKVQDPDTITQVTLRHIRLAAISVKRFSKKKQGF